MDALESSIFRHYEWAAGAYEAPAQIFWELLYGTQILQIDEALYAYFYNRYRHRVLFELADRFGLELARYEPLALGGGGIQFAEFFVQGDKFYLRPPGVSEN